MATVPPPVPTQGLVARLLTFDTMIGGGLIKIIYFIGLAFIGLAVLIGLIGALGSMAYSPVGILGVLLVVVGGVFGVLFWRFSCELWILLFRIYDVLVDIRNRS